MKAPGRILSGILIVVSMLSALKAQSPVYSDWAGSFMGQFRLVLQLDIKGSDQGRIKMFDETNMIQDDLLDDIKVEDGALMFTIPAKETSYYGTFNDSLNRLSGYFVFPNGERHPIELYAIEKGQTSIAHDQDWSNRTFTRNQFIEDLEYLVASLKQYHPRPFEYVTEDSFDLAVSRLGDMTDQVDLDRVYLSVSQVTDMVHCSHTGVRLPTAYCQFTRKRGSFFPLGLFFDRGKAFVVASPPGLSEKIPFGSEIVNINKRPIRTIIDTLFYLVPSEGLNTTTKYNALNRHFPELYQRMDNSDRFELEFVTREGAEISIVLTAGKGLNDSMAHDPLTDSPELDYIDIGNTEMGLIKVSSFAIGNMDEYLARLDSIFKDLRLNETAALALDLRDNPGGHPIFAAQLLSYLTVKDFIYFKRNPEATEFEPLYETMKSNPLAFEGDLYVFVNGGCLSTTGHLISLLKHYTDARFIGEEPGSTYTCNDMSIQQQLPQSGIEVNIPRTTFETSVWSKAAGPIEVDIPVSLTWEDAANNDDIYIRVLKSVLQ